MPKIFVRVLLAVVLALVALPIRAEEPPLKDPIIPRALRPGDTIALVAPARGVGQERIDIITAGLARMGYKSRTFGNVTGAWGYLSDEDEARGAAIMQAWRDPDVDAIFCLTGGYGTMRMLDFLDYSYIQKNPKILTGFSDITGLHLAIHKKTGLVTFHTPTTQFVYSGDEAARPFATRFFWGTLNASAYQDGKPNAALVYTQDDATSPMLTFSPGKARGALTGGNLSLVHALMGTPYEIETKGRILFLEDVGEEPYRVDRMLRTLQLAGKLDGLAGVVLGQWADCNPEKPESSFSLDEVLRQYFENRPYPVLAYFPVGHVEENASLPVGWAAELDADNRTLRILEPPVTLK